MTSVEEAIFSDFDKVTIIYYSLILYLQQIIFIKMRGEEFTPEIQMFVSLQDTLHKSYLHKIEYV